MNTCAESAKHLLIGALLAPLRQALNASTRLLICPIPLYMWVEDGLVTYC